MHIMPITGEMGSSRLARWVLSAEVGSCRVAQEQKEIADGGATKSTPQNHRPAARQAQIAKTAGPNILRHGLATGLRAAGYDIRTVQEFLGHKEVSTADRL